MNKEVIVIGYDHYHTLWLIRSFGMAAFIPSCIIIGCNEHKSFVSKSKFLNKCFFVDSLSELPTFLMQLQQKEKTVVVASGDPVAEVLDNNYDLLSSKYILHSCNNTQGQIVYWMDKKHMLIKAKECGLTIPQTLTIKTSECDNLPKVNFPCLIKPELSAESSKDYFRICNNEIELINTIQSLKKELSEVIIQDYIKRDYEYLIYGVSTKDCIFMPGGLRKVYTCSSEKNLGMMTFGYVSSEVPNQIGDFDKIKRFVRSIGYMGLFSVEFMITKEDAYFLEINLRNDGTCYITTQAGVNLPALWATSNYNGDSSAYQHKFKRTRIYGMNEINYMKYTLREIGIMQTFFNVFKTSAFSLFMLKDIKPFFFKLKYHHG